MSTYNHLKKQIAKLEKEAEALRKRERAEVIARIKDAIAVYEITAEDLDLPRNLRTRRDKRPRKGDTNSPWASGSRQSARNQGNKTAAGGIRLKQSAVIDRRSSVAPKYRDSATGATWTGRGRQPKWLVAAIQSGRKLEEFKI